MYASGKARNNDGDLGSFVYKKSMPVGGGNIVLCALTGIFYGGWCWTYLGMPNSGHRKKLRASLIADLEKETGTSSIKLDQLKIKRLSWSSVETSLDLNKTQGSSIIKKKVRPAKSASESDDSSEDFLR
ncbi:MAG: hypothetical protein ACJAT2_000652 [Bacteriovoracaceae bacterium]|jgi:hypothetical protein